MGFYNPPSTPPWFIPNRSSNLLTGLAGVGGVPPGSLLGDLGLLTVTPPIVPAPPYGWWYVTRRFTRLLANLALTDRQRQDGETSQRGVRARLNRHYWGYSSVTANSSLIGSWGKNTGVRPPRDVDILFLLPPSVYWRFQARAGNKQSQLLQEVKTVLAPSYPQTTMSADGQVILIPFQTIQIEISLGFVCQDGSIIVCDTNNDGFYKTSTAQAESLALDASDLTWNGNTRALARMMKQWQRNCNVATIKSFHFERLAVEFLGRWLYSHKDVFYYDWMVRDFLGYLIGRANGSLCMPGTGEIVPLGSDWLSRAQTAHRHAIEASINERDNYQVLAGMEWQKIFGGEVPVLVT
jgi:hypothetical protein